MKFLALLIGFLLVLVLTPSIALAQSDNHTAREEKEGKEIWEKLQTKQLECKNLTDGDFGALGEYYMGQMTGASHEAMNTMMEQMMGKEGEEQMHVVMGKRLSGCDASAALPQNGVGFMPMMWMMPPLRQGFAGQGGGGNPMMGTGWGNMMGGLSGFGVFGSSLVTLTWLVWLIVGILTAIWLFKQISKK